MKQQERTQVIIDENTIYEIDLDCLECKNQEEKKEIQNNNDITDS